jgi:hypothetical protein
MPNSNKINPLIAIPSPRNIKVINDCHDNLSDYDKLWMKDNFDELQAYQVLRNYFLENPEYTHLVIAPDDLLIPVSTFEKLIADLNKKDYPVLSGVCNFNCERFSTYDMDLAVDYNHKNGMEHLLQNEVPHYRHYLKSGQLKGIKRVAFAGFSLAFIRRDVVERIPFGTKARGIDSDYSYKLLMEKIDQYVDFDARSLHLKGIENCENIAPLMIFQFDNSVNTAVNFKRQVTPRLVFQKAGSPEKQELDYQKYI